MARAGRGHRPRLRWRRGHRNETQQSDECFPRRPRPAGMRPTATRYDKDVLLWSQEQARLLRACRFDELNIEHLADEIEDVGKSEKRESANRMAVLLAHLLKWQVQPRIRTNSWRATIKDQRAGGSRSLSRRRRARDSGSLATRDWQRTCGSMREARHARKWGLTDGDVPEACPGTMDQAADADFSARISRRGRHRPEPLPHPSPTQSSTDTAPRKSLLAHLRLDRRLATRGGVRGGGWPSSAKDAGELHAASASSRIEARSS